MPRRKLTARSLGDLEPIEGRRTEYFDQSLPGFAVRVSPSGRKSFSVLYRIGRRLRRHTLGRYPVLSLGEARVMARKALLEVARGGDPGAKKVERRQAPSFAELAEDYIERHAKPNKRSWREDRRIIKNKLNPVLGRMPAGEVSRADVRVLLEAIVRRPAPIEANRTHALIRRLYNWALSQDLVEKNPCYGLPRPARERMRHDVLTAEGIRRLWLSLDEERALIASHFRLRLLTAQRGGELLTMEWEHVDLETAWWTIPGERTKNGLPHRVPLSPPAMAILERLRRQAGGSLWVFPSPKSGSHLKHVQAAVARVRRRAGIDFWAHDLRRTAASFMTSMGISRLVVAKILNHVERGVTAVYDRHSYDPEKRQALDAWAARLEGIVKGKQKTGGLSPDSTSSPPEHR